MHIVTLMNRQIVDRLYVLTRLWLYHSDRIEENYVSREYCDTNIEEDRQWLRNIEVDINYHANKLYDVENEIREIIRFMLV